MAMPEEDPPPGLPEWLLTYGDMMSLLLCFFILLAGMSEIKNDTRMQMAMESILREFGDARAMQNFMAAQGLTPKGLTTGPSKDAAESKTPSSRRRAEAGGMGKPGNKRRVQTVRDGRRQIIGGPVVFEPGQAQLVPEALQELQKIAVELRGKRHIVEVKGYEPLTMPSNSSFADPTSLTVARLHAVVEALVKEGLRPELIRKSIAAAAEGEVIPQMDTGEPMLQRVDVQTLEATGNDYQHQMGPPVAEPATTQAGS